MKIEPKRPPTEEEKARGNVEDSTDMLWMFAVYFGALFLGFFLIDLFRN